MWRLSADSDTLHAIDLHRTPPNRMRHWPGPTSGGEGAAFFIVFTTSPSRWETLPTNLHDLSSQLVYSRDPTTKLWGPLPAGSANQDMSARRGKGKVDKGSAPSASRSPAGSQRSHSSFGVRGAGHTGRVDGPLDASVTAAQRDILQKTNKDNQSKHFRSQLPLRPQCAVSSRSSQACRLSRLFAHDSLFQIGACFSATVYSGL